jgi:hypothetical protein
MPTWLISRLLLVLVFSPFFFSSLWTFFLLLFCW